MTQIKEILEITPIITNKNKFEFFLQSRIHEHKQCGIKLTKKQMERLAMVSMHMHVYNMHIGSCVSELIPNRLVLNLENLKLFRSYEKDFMRVICNAISHEIMHKVLEINEGHEACEKFDNIYHIKLSGYGVCLDDIKNTYERAFDIIPRKVYK